MENLNFKSEEMFSWEKIFKKYEKELIFKGKE